MMVVSLYLFPTYKKKIKSDTRSCHTAGMQNNVDRGVRHWQEYRRTSELKYIFVSVYARVFLYTI